MKDYDIIVKMSTPAFNEDDALDRLDWILNFIQKELSLDDYSIEVVEVGEWVE